MFNQLRDHARKSITKPASSDLSDGARFLPVQQAWTNDNLFVVLENSSRWQVIYIANAVK